MTDVEVSNFCSYLCFKISVSLFSYVVAYPVARTFKTCFTWCLIILSYLFCLLYCIIKKYINRNNVEVSSSSLSHGYDL